jgi:hypothetical protein
MLYERVGSLWGAWYSCGGRNPLFMVVHVNVKKQSQWKSFDTCLSRPVFFELTGYSPESYIRRFSLSSSNPSIFPNFSHPMLPHICYVYLRTRPEELFWASQVQSRQKEVLSWSAQGGNVTHGLGTHRYTRKNKQTLAGGRPRTENTWAVITWGDATGRVRSGPGTIRTLRVITCLLERRSFKNDLSRGWSRHSRWVPWRNMAAAGILSVQRVPLGPQVHEFRNVLVIFWSIRQCARPSDIPWLSEPS